jgi:hypothetical protein
VASLVTYLRYSHAISYQRLSQLMRKLYGLSLSQGPIANLLQRVQVCLAHQLRDCQYAIDAGDELFALPMKRLFLKAIALQRRRHTLAVSTIEQYCARFCASLREILNLEPKSVEGQRLLKRYQKIRDHLLLFLTDETVPPTNNAKSSNPSYRC